MNGLVGKLHLVHPARYFIKLTEHQKVLHYMRSKLWMHADIVQRHDHVHHSEATHQSCAARDQRPLSPEV